MRAIGSGRNVTIESGIETHRHAIVDIPSRKWNHQPHMPGAADAGGSAEVPDVRTFVSRLSHDMAVKENR